MVAKITENAFLYLDPKGDEDEFAQCSTCPMWTGPENNTCTIHGKDVEVTGDMSCGLYVNGKPMPESAGHEISTVTPKESGLVKGDVRCENCEYFETEGSICGLFRRLNKANEDMTLREKVDAKGCCNAFSSATIEDIRKANDIEHDYHKFYVGLVVVNTLGQVLLGKRREDGIWTGPGGSSEGNETPRLTAVREAFEEAQLEIQKDRLIELDTMEAADGKPVFCYMYIARPYETGTATNLDPDKEVKKWNWYSPSDIPADIGKDSNRHQAVMNGLMKLKGLKKGNKFIAMQDHERHEQYAADTRKEGTEPAIREPVEQTEKAAKKKKPYRKLAKLLKAKKVPIGTKHNGMEKVAEGKWIPIKEGSGKTPAADEGQSKHHSDEAGRHMAESAKHAELAAKLKEKIKHRKNVDPSYEAPEKAQSLLDESETKAKAHAEDYKTKKTHADDAQSDVDAESQAGQIKDSKKKVSEKNKMIKLEEGASVKKSYKKLDNVLKAIIGQYDNVDTAIGTTDYTVAENAAGEWLDKFKDLMVNYNYGDAPRTMDLDRGYSMMMTKVDDGLYSGFIKQKTDWDGESQLEENRAKIERQTLPEIIQYLKAKEYIYPETRTQSVSRIESELEDEGKGYGMYTEGGYDAADGLANSGMGMEEQGYDAASMYRTIDPPQAIQNEPTGRIDEPMAVNMARAESEEAEYDSKKLRFMELLSQMLNRI